MKKFLAFALLLIAPILALAAPTVYGPNSSSYTVAVVVGQNVKIDVTADGTTPFTYQWYKDGNIWVGMTSSNVTFAAVQLYDGGAYKCVITNSKGSTSSPVATITVSNPSAAVAPSNSKSTTTVN